MISEAYFKMGLLRNVEGTAHEPGSAPAQTKFHTSSRRFSINLASSLGALSLSLAVGVWYVPYLIRNLGTASYGMIPLTGSIVAYLSLGTLGLNMAVSRYLTMALSRGDRDESNRVFNTSLFGMLLVAIILVVPVVLLTAFADKVFHIPNGQLHSVRLLLGLTGSAFLLSAVASPFQVSTFSRNRFDLRGAISTLELMVRVGVVVILFRILSPQLAHVGVGLLLAALASAIGSIWAWRRLTPELSISLAGTDWKTFREISKTSGWAILNQIGTILFLNVDLLVVNRLFGPGDGGRYAALLQWSMLIRNFASTGATVFGPAMMGLAATGNIDELVSYSRNSVRFMAITLAAPIGLLCGMSKPLLTLWLGPDFSALWPLLVLMVLPLAVNLAAMPILNINIALNKIRTPGLVMLALGAGNVALAIILSRNLGWGLYGIAAAGAIVLTGKNALFTPLYAANVIARPVRELSKGLTLSVVLSLAVAISAFASYYLLDTHTWLQLALTSALLVAAYAAFVYLALLSAKERQLVKQRFARPVRASAALIP